MRQRAPGTARPNPPLSANIDNQPRTTMFSDIPLPEAFAFLTALSLLIYMVLDGFDLGIGILSAFVHEKERDAMILTIAPFWDANETWLILAAGLVLVAFPQAQGIIFGALYLPTAILLVGILFRGAAFDFRAKGSPKLKRLWDMAFFGGSLTVAAAQGYMLGLFVTGFEQSPFVYLAAFLAVTAYGMIGAAWLILRAGGSVRRKAFRFGFYSMAAGLAAILIDIAAQHGDMAFTPTEVALGAAGGLALILPIALHGFCAKRGNRFAWVPFAGCVVLFAAVVSGLAVHCYPYVVYGRMTIREAAADEASLQFMFAGALAALPLIILYHVAAHVIFRGGRRIPSGE